MSCFHVSALHISTLAAFAQLDCKIPAEKAARILRQLNNASMRARYKDSPARIPRATDLHKGLTHLAEFPDLKTRAAYSLALAQCLAYQCDSAPENHPGRAMLDGMMFRARQCAGNSAGMFPGVWSV